VIANTQFEERKQKMPAYSTLDLICEVNEAIASLGGRQFALNELVQIINESRKKRNVKRKVSSESVYRILTRLWLPLNIRKVTPEIWEKGTGPIRGMTKVRPDLVERVIQHEDIRYKNVLVTPQEIDRWIGLGEESITRRAYICYPYRDNPLKRSMEILVLLVHLYPKAKDEFAPATPHDMYWGLEERRTREIAMNECEKLILQCDFVLNCLRRGEKPSAGMIRDMEIAKAHNKEIKYIEDILEYYPNVSDVLISCGLSEFTPQVEAKKIAPVVATLNSMKKIR
jgi:hypothetical protein